MEDAMVEDLSEKMNFELRDKGWEGSSPKENWKISSRENCKCKWECSKDRRKDYVAGVQWQMRKGSQELVYLRWLDKEDAVRIYDWILLCHKK